MADFPPRSHRSVGSLGEGYSEYRYIARQNVAINAYVEDIFEARVASLKYRYDPSSNLRDEVVSNINEVLEEKEFLIIIQQVKDQNSISSGVMRSGQEIKN